MASALSPASSAGSATWSVTLQRDYGGFNWDLGAWPGQHQLQRIIHGGSASPGGQGGDLGRDRLHLYGHASAESMTRISQPFSAAPGKRTSTARTGHHTANPRPRAGTEG